MRQRVLQRAALIAVSFLTAAASGYWALRWNFGALFGPIDDHEPLGWLGPSGSLSLPDAIQVLLLETEVGDIGAAMRFRPAYYSFRVAQAVLFTDHASAWYASTFLLFVVANSIFGLTMAWWLRFALRQAGTPARLEFGISVVSTVAYTLMAVSISAWSGIVTRLGPSELLGATMVGASLLATTALLAGRRGFWWVVLVVSVWAAVFSKEVLLPIALLPALAALGSPSRQLGARLRWSLALVGLIPAGLLIAAVTPPLVAGTGSAYGSKSDVSRVSATFEGIFHVLPSYWAPAALTAGAAVVVFSGSFWRIHRRLAVTIAGLYGLSLLWFAFDALIYYGTYELPRYGLSWQLLKVVWIAGAVALSASLLGRPRRWWPTFPAGVVLLLSGLLLMLGLVGVPHRLESTQAASSANASQTRQYQDQMNVVRSALAANPSTNVAIVVDRLTDYEPVRAVSQSLENFTDGAVVAIINPKASSLDLLRTLDLPVSGVVLPDDLGTEQWTCVYLHSDSQSVEGCPENRSYIVETWAM